MGGIPKEKQPIWETVIRRPGRKHGIKHLTRGLSEKAILARLDAAYPDGYDLHMAPMQLQRPKRQR